MESNATPLEAIFNCCNQTIDNWRKLAEAVSNILVSLTSFQKTSRDFVANNYLKMHGKRTIRRKALERYERRHHSG